MTRPKFSATVFLGSILALTQLAGAATKSDLEKLEARLNRNLHDVCICADGSEFQGVVGALTYAEHRKNGNEPTTTVTLACAVGDFNADGSAPALSDTTLCFAFEVLPK